MFIGEQVDENISKLEIRDVTFLKNDLPQRGDMISYLDLFEIDEFAMLYFNLFHRLDMIVKNFILVGVRGLFKFLKKDHCIVVKVP